MIYKASLGTAAKIITVVITIFFGAIIIGQYSFMEEIEEVSTVFLTEFILLSIYYNRDTSANKLSS
jgi:hypothetical protein